MDPVYQSESAVSQAHRMGFLTVKQARMHFASRPSLQAIRKWMKIGVHNRTVPDGKGPRIKLQSICEGAMWLTRPEWVKAFIAACESNHK